MCECCASHEKADVYLPELAVIEQRRLMNATELYLRVRMDSGRPFEYLPGQFIELSVMGIGEAPFTIASSPTQGFHDFELVVRNTGGNVSKAVHQLGVGDKIGIRGPFGHGYPFKEVKGHNIIFISGGIGLVPQRSMIKYVLDNRSDYGDVSILFGTKNYQQRFFLDELTHWNHREDVDYLETLDEGDENWMGNVGVVTTLIPKISTDIGNADIFICGPPVMYKFVIFSLIEHRVSNERVFLNLERNMKCGVGKCGHCQINNLYVCRSGPVFSWAQLDGVPEALA
jgi:NAD(P)H-flavin reductase